MSVAEDEGYETEHGPTMADLDAHHQQPNGRRNGVPLPTTLNDIHELAKQHRLEPFRRGTKNPEIVFWCPICQALGTQATASAEIIAGALSVNCGGCHDDIAPGILVKLATPGTVTNETPATAPRASTVLSWAEYRSKTQPEIKWLVRGLIPAHGFCVIGSTPKAGKTWFLSLLAISCATGKPFLGQFVVVKPVRVHFLALEGSAAALRHRIGCLARGLGIDPDGDLLGENLHIDYKPKGANLSEAPYAAWYCDEVQRVDAQLCLIDTVRRAARIRESGAGVEDLQVLGENLEPLRDTRSVLFAHHARKLQPANQNGTWTPPLERLSGSGDWGGLVEMGLVLDRRKGTEWRDTRMEIDGRDIPGFLPKRIIYEGSGSGAEGMLTYADELEVRIEEIDDGEDEGGSLKAEEVSAWLATRPRVEAVASQIAEHFGVSKRTVQRSHGSFSKWGITWNDPDKGKSRSYWLNSPSYAESRGTET